MQQLYKLYDRFQKKNIKVHEFLKYNNNTDMFYRA